MPEVTCTYFPKCRGCDHWDDTYEQQKQNKVRRLKQILNVTDEVFSEKDFVSIQPYGLRHRFDFTVESQGDQQHLGFYDANKKLIDIETCLQLSPELQEVFTLFRSIPLKSSSGLIRKASVRLRVSPGGRKGCWLDLANIDIKSLLDDSECLNQLLEAGFEIEMGQKGKRVQRLNGKLKLVEPQAQVWFRSNPFLLKTQINDFTQPSWFSAEALVKVVKNWVQKLPVQNAIEFGPGIGQFTLPLLAQGLQIEAFENNPKAIEVLELNAKDNNLSDRLKISSGDFQNKKATLTHAFDLAFVNPPRSGLKGFVQTILDARAKYCIYISCFPESMQEDLEKMKQAGYQIRSACIVDQFPQTAHFESCVLLEKSDERVNFKA